MTNLAVHVDRRGGLIEAGRLLRCALAIVSRAPGDQGRSVAKITNNLAWCLRARGGSRRATHYARRPWLCSAAGCRPTTRQSPPSSTTSQPPCTTRAGTRTPSDTSARCVAIMVKRLGPAHPETAFSRANLGVNLYHQGKFDEADGHHRAVLAAYRRVLGDGHPSTAWAYTNVVGDACARGDYAGAEELAPAATASFESARLRLGLAGLDRALSTRDISPLTALAVAAARRAKPAAAWEALERNLARGLLDEMTARRQSDDDRRQQALADDVDQLDQRIDLLLARGEAAAADRRETQAKRDTAQAKLVQIQEELADKNGVAAGQVYGLAAIQKQLPDDAALLTWVDLSAAPKWADPKGDHWACLVRHRGDPVWVQLRGAGPGGAWTDGDDRLAARTRRALAARPDDRGGEWTDLAGKLADQRLGPLEGELKAVRQLIVLPSAKMAGVPVDALPGAADRFVVSYAPSGTMFAWLREHRVQRGPRPGLLALGDPAFPPPRDDGPNAKPGRPRPAGRREAFAPLPGTGAELAGVARIFRSKRVLTGSEASEQDLEELAAADRLRDYRFLHFATHGVLDSQRPMRSALILAQDRLPDPLAPAAAGRETCDGRLTAERILRRWKLDAEMVTLSGCDTGLGRFSDGEGHLGFSQALFLAGARSLVLSLWEVDDASTALLMTRFYENLLGEGSVKSMSKAEALAEAKRWLRGLGPDEVGQLTKDLATRGTRGRVIDRQPAGKVAAARTYEHPYYWSGFILIGDPR